MDSTHDNSAALLQGLRVLELATWVAAPTIGGILAEYGADVANGFFIDAHHDAVGSYRALTFPMRFVGAAPRFRGQAPGHGEQSREILSELGLDAQAIERLHELGVVRLPEKPEHKG